MNRLENVEGILEACLPWPPALLIQALFTVSIVYFPLFVVGKYLYSDALEKRITHPIHKSSYAEEIFRISITAYTSYAFASSMKFC